MMVEAEDVDTRLPQYLMVFPFEERECLICTKVSPSKWEWWNKSSHLAGLLRDDVIVTWTLLEDALARSKIHET